MVVDQLIIQKKLNPLLKIAVKQGDQSVVSFLLSREGTDVNATDSKGRSALIWAAKCGRTEICRYQLDAGADLSICDNNNKDAFYYARRDNRFEIELLLIVYSSVEAITQIVQDSPAGPSYIPDSVGLTMEEGEDEPVPAEELCSLPEWEEDEELLPFAHDTVEPSMDWGAGELVPDEEIGDCPEWEVVNTTLPYNQKRREHGDSYKASNEFNDDVRKALRHLFLVGLEDGRLPKRSLAEVLFRNDGEQNKWFEACLKLVLGDLGVILDQEDSDWNYPAFPDEENTELANDALAFFEELVDQYNDPYLLYVEDMKKCFRK